MIDPHLAQIILSTRKYGYLITDCDLVVVHVWGDGDFFPECNPSSLGLSIFDIVPELIGSQDLLAQILAGQRTSTQLELVARQPADGETRYMSLLDLPYRTDTGDIQGIIHLIEDVTETGVVQQRLAQRRNELQLLQDQLIRKNLELAAANAELREMNELKSTFVAVAAHELRNPLTSVVGFLEILQDGDAGPLTQTQKNYLDIIAKSVDRLHTLTNGLSNMIHLDAGCVEMILKPVDLLALVHQVVQPFAGDLEAKSQQLTISAPPQLPLALCDKLWMGHALTNLVSNAIKYTNAKGQIQISLSPHPQDRLHLTIRDNGIGISAAEQKKLFTRFYRSERAQKLEPGMGLGLYIVRSLIELHGGEIWLESSPNVGSTFHVTLPAAT